MALNKIVHGLYIRAYIIKNFKVTPKYVCVLHSALKVKKLCKRGNLKALSNIFFTSSSTLLDAPPSRWLYSQSLRRLLGRQIATFSYSIALWCCLRLCGVCEKNSSSSLWEISRLFPTNTSTHSSAWVLKDSRCCWLRLTDFNLNSQHQIQQQVDWKVLYWLLTLLLVNCWETIHLELALCIEKTQ